MNVPEFNTLTCAKCDGEGATPTAAGLIECTCTWGMRCPNCTRPVRLIMVESDRDSVRRAVYATISCDACEWTMVSPKASAPRNPEAE